MHARAPPKKSPVKLAGHRAWMDKVTVPLGIFMPSVAFSIPAYIGPSLSLQATINSAGGMYESEGITERKDRLSDERGL